MPLPIRWRYKLDRWRAQFASLFRSEPRAARPRLCPACGTLVGSTARRCHQCGASLTFSLAAASRSLSRLFPQASPVSYAILGVCVLLYVVSLLATLRSGSAAPGGLFGLGGIAGEVLARMGASAPWRFNVAEPWRFVTAMFLHGSLIHIGFNMWVMMDLGPTLEELYGSARFLFLFVVAGAVGFLASSFFGHFSVGASGALLGLVGALLALTVGRHSAGMRMLRGQLINWLIYIAVLGLLMPGIDNAAHIGGLATGFLLGRILPDRPPADPAELRRARLMGWTAGAVVGVSFLFMLRNYF